MVGARLRQSVPVGPVAVRGGLDVGLEHFGETLGFEHAPGDLVDHDAVQLNMSGTIICIYWTVNLLFQRRLAYIFLCEIFNLVEMSFPVLADFAEYLLIFCGLGLPLELSDASLAFGQLLPGEGKGADRLGIGLHGLRLRRKAAIRRY